MKAEYALPSNVYNEVKIDNPNDKFSFFEIEVNGINFITDKSIKASPPSTSSLSLSPSPSPSVSLYGNDKSPGQPKASSLSQHQSAGVLSGVVVGGIGAVTAKIICWGEQWEAAAAAAASVSISCAAAACSSSSKGSNGIKKLCAGRHQIQKQSSSQQQQQLETRKKHQLQRRRRRRRSTRQPHPLQKQHNLHHQHNKLRYCLRSKSLALFLEYLRECPSIEIVANSSSSSDHAYDQKSSPTEASGAARLPLPAPLLQRSKYAAKNNVTVDCNFVQDKTKIYALYRHVESRGTSSQVQQQQQLKIAEFFQLRFNMLFAAAATAASANKTVRIGAAATVPPPLPLPPPTAATPLPAALLQDHKLTITSLSSQSQPGEHIAGTAPAPATVAAPAKQVELMEAMKKLDADLVALFAATAAAEPKMEKLKQQQQLWRDGEEQLELSGAAADELSVGEEQQQLELQLQKEQQQEEEQATTPELFKLVNLLQLHLEALTLQPEGTKRMELLQSEVRPIFTVECQLSDELIRSVPRAPMFHIMQFESEKFQSLTQCTRFGQTQQRQVHMSQATQEKEQENMGFIQFTIWWREPGTCLNELLGMGRLPLAELYRASLLEQCKCITIQRRDLHLASLYLKISLRSDQQLMFNRPQLPVPNTNNNNNSCNNNNNSSSSNNHNNNNKSYHSGAAAGEYI